MSEFVEKGGKTFKVIYTKRIKRNGTIYYPTTAKYFRFLVEVK